MKRPIITRGADRPSGIGVDGVHLLSRLGPEERHAESVRLRPEGLRVREERVQAGDEGRGPEVGAGPAVRRDLGGRRDAHGVRLEHGEHVRHAEACVRDKLCGAKD